MEKEKIKEIGADSLPELLKKANQREISKEQFLSIILINGELHLIYVD